MAGEYNFEGGADSLGAGGFSLGGGGTPMNFDLPTMPANPAPIEAAMPGTVWTPPSMAGGGGREGDPGQPRGGGGDGILDQLAGYASKAMPFMKLGLAGMGAYTGVEAANQAKEQNALLRKSEERTAAAAAPASAAAARLLPAGTDALLGGALPPELEAQVSQWEQDTRMRFRTMAAHMGIDVSTMEGQVEAWIEEQKPLMRAQLAQQLMGAGGAAASTAISGNSSVAGTAGRQGSELSAAMGGANQALNALMAS